MGLDIAGDDERLLTGREERAVKNAFNTARLPPFSRIRIRNGLSPNGTPITYPNYRDRTFNISVGQRLFDSDLTDFSSDGATLIHEMTHVWQYYHHLLTRAHGLVAHARRNLAERLGYRGEAYLYEYDILTDSWNDMGFEGQAQLVEDWYHDGMKPEDQDKRFCFVRKVLWDGSARARTLNVLHLCETDFYPPPGPDPEPIRVEMRDDSFVMIMKGDVMFEFDKFEIKPAAVSILAKAAQNIRALWRNGTLIRVNGYTDSVGSDDYNNRLSERRAQAVANWLSSHGLQGSAIKPIGFGKAHPVASNNDESGRAKNRRVEIFLTRS